MVRKVEDGLHYTKHSGSTRALQSLHEHALNPSAPIPKYMASIDSNHVETQTASLFTEQFEDLEHLHTLNVVHSQTQEPVSAQMLFHRQRSISMPDVGDVPPYSRTRVPTIVTMHQMHQVPAYRIQRSTSMTDNHNKKVVEVRANVIDLPPNPEFLGRTATEELPPIPWMYVTM